MPLVAATLDHLRGAAEPEAFVLLDVASLLGSLADDRQACGQDVGLTMGPVRPLRAQTSSLRRCIDNLVDNARHHKGQLSLRNAEPTGLIAALTLPRRSHPH